MFFKFGIVSIKNLRKRKVQVGSVLLMRMSFKVFYFFIPPLHLMLFELNHHPHLAQSLRKP
ncbi:hypothetical protein DD752_03555 [Helicobacter pylori]|nr:hypothetical protein DD752_03555 [Helicobacter pylori]RVZ74319.1 hypothetical protein EC592_02075 [Helicobacter pylori]